MLRMETDPDQYLAWVDYKNIYISLHNTEWFLEN